MKKVIPITGSGVLADENGTFPECQSRVHECGYACCQFGKIGNWISMLPGEREAGVAEGLSFDHLRSVDREGVEAINCTRPCVPGDFKPLDCHWYPLWPSNADATEFIVASHSKCPIPYDELITLAKKVGEQARAWDEAHTGTLRICVESAMSFVAYEKFPYRVDVGGEVTEL